ncbi:acetyl-CoA carboxylase, carboxyl transferase subunit beta [Candidatus Omnitrophus magneticus]|uniref:Acetyl-coenzyme A carboxylase carboxyl transferase subunit beta n=1 Tax=Candidatus Omnitrophus magneticus TaxID=1609969 RepID=A0A0F0CVK6_9BACT|nr:acetyl-CoA carboxylase, carboxyl transferase subunit beta [Candidatus Omnitrophus magneticus]
MAFFLKKPKIFSTERKNIPGGLWIKCIGCGELLYNKNLKENSKVCKKCGYHFTIGAYERVALLIDEGTFHEIYKNMESLDPLNFKGPSTYLEKLKKDRKFTGLSDAVVVGEGMMNGKRVAIGVTDSRFIMGSMGSVVGEKITRLIEYAELEGIPLIIVSGSGGGARMYEGMLSLMQMAKTSAALHKFNKKGGLFISVLTNPTMAGIMASFASLGDIIMAEPGALIGFTGPRVIQQTIKQTLPEGFQSSEFLLKHGLIDMIVSRFDMKTVLSNLAGYFCGKNYMK